MRDLLQETEESTEISLGTGRLLAIFFVLVATCGLFFGLGFSLGRSSVEPTVSAGGGDAATSLKSASGVSKPSAGTPDCSVPGACPDSRAAELTFYKAVEQNTPNTDMPAAAPPPSPLGTPGYVVQVAAVSKHQDAEALLQALRERQYPAFIATNEPVDKLFRVQVGPYSDLTQAEATRSRLVSDGYNPILKR